MTFRRSTFRDWPLGGGTPGTPAYVTTGKAIRGYDPDFERYHRPDMWPSDNGSVFTFAAFLRMPDQPTNLLNRMILSSINNNFGLRFREWYNFTDLGGDTNRFSTTASNQDGDGYHVLELGEGAHGIDSGDWFAYMFSMDYSGAAAVIETWVHKSGDVSATDIGAGTVLLNDSGPLTFDWDDASAVTSVGMHPNELTNQGDYDIAEIYVTNEAVDWSLEANRLKYVDSAGKPVGLGANGSELTGTQPKHYAPDGNLTNNLGTETHWSEFGTIANSSTSPTD